MGDRSGRTGLKHNGRRQGTPVSDVPEQSWRAQVRRGRMAKLRGGLFQRSRPGSRWEQCHRRCHRHAQPAGAHDHASCVMCRYVAVCRDARLAAGSLCNQRQIAGRRRRRYPVMSARNMENRRGCKDKYQQHHEPASGHRRLATPAWSPLNDTTCLHGNVLASLGYLATISMAAGMNQGRGDAGLEVRGEIA
jgi:hypothetical protein